MPHPIEFPTTPTAKIRIEAANARTMVDLLRIILRMVREIERSGARRRSCACCWRNCSGY